jgi:hypothetical protein
VPESKLSHNDRAINGFATRTADIFRGKNTVALRATKKSYAWHSIRFFSPKGGVFATMMALFWNKTVLGFWHHYLYVWSINWNLVSCL